MLKYIVICKTCSKSFLHLSMNWYSNSKISLYCSFIDVFLHNRHAMTLLCWWFGTLCWTPIAPFYIICWQMHLYATTVTVINNKLIVRGIVWKAKSPAGMPIRHDKKHRNIFEEYIAEKRKETISTAFKIVGYRYRNG